MLGISEAVDVSRLHRNDGSCDVTDTRDRHQQLDGRSWAQACFEVFLQLLAMLGGLKTLLMVHHQRHSIFLRDRALVQKVGEAGLVG
jgi:hypothetical protein